MHSLDSLFQEDVLLIVLQQAIVSSLQILVQDYAQLNVQVANLVILTL
jgi:hypothetical protein